MDTTANFLTSLRNAEMARHSQLTVPASKMTMALLAILKETGYILDFKKEEAGIVISTKLTAAGHSYRRISKPGRRLYVGADEIPVVRNGKGMVIISTSKGVISGFKARKEGLGGELICEVY